MYTPYGNPLASDAWLRRHGWAANPGATSHGEPVQERTCPSCIKALRAKVEADTTPQEETLF